jgi:NADH-quinone oxidoreductase subunit M
VSSALHLSFPLWLPFAGGLVALVLPRRVSWVAALLGSLFALGYAIKMVVDFEPGVIQHITDEEWISSLGIHYKLGVDGLNVFLVLLTTVLFSAALVWAARTERDRSRTLWMHMGLAQTAVLGALLAQDLALFVVFFDLMLVPFFFLAGMFGPGDRAERVAATTRLVIYTLVGSLLMLTAAVATGVLSSPNEPISFAFTDLAGNELAEGTQQWIFLLFAAAFLVKMPAFPLHGWLRDGYRAMPLPALAVFSAVLSKVAAYGFLKVALPLFPDAAAHFQTLMLAIATISILYGSAMAFTVTDVRLILAYSSVAQLGFITLGIFSLTGEGAQGALMQMVNHGIVVAPAFFLLAVLAARAGGSEDVRDMGGIAFRAPVLAAMLLIVAFANLAMPGSPNFVGEFLILLGTFESHMAFALVASLGVVMAAVYMLRAFIGAMHNRAGERVDSREIGVRDGAIVGVLVACVLALALYPQLLLRDTDEAAATAVAQAQAIADPDSVPGAGEPGFDEEGVPEETLPEEGFEEEGPPPEFEEEGVPPELEGEELPEEELEFEEVPEP